MKKIEVACECGPRKIDLLDVLILKDGTSGVVCEFDNSPLGYDICIRSSIGTGETVRRWIRRDEIADEHDEGDRTAADYADDEPRVTEF